MAGKMHDGYGSKKFWFAIGVCLLAFVYAVLAATKLGELKAMFETFTGILEFVTGAYLTGNIANKWVAGKVGGDQPDPVPAPSKPAAKAQPADPLDRDVPAGGHQK